MKALCSGCSKTLRKLDDATGHGFDHRTNEEVFTCRKCLLEAAAKANMVLAHRRLSEAETVHWDRHGVKLQGAIRAPLRGQR